MYYTLYVRHIMLYCLIYSSNICIQCTAVAKIKGPPKNMCVLSINLITIEQKCLVSLFSEVGLLYSDFYDIAIWQQCLIAFKFAKARTIQILNEVWWSWKQDVFSWSLSPFSWRWHTLRTTKGWTTLRFEIHEEDREASTVRHGMGLDHCQRTLWFGAFPEWWENQCNALPQTAGWESAWEVHEKLHMTFTNTSIFQQDSAPCHTAKSVKAWFANNVSLLQNWPPNSPDLNVIENCWALMKRKVAAHRPSSEKNLREVLKRVWTQEITAEYCETLVRSMPSRLAAVIKNNGFPVKYWFWFCMFYSIGYTYTCTYNVAHVLVRCKNKFHVKINWNYSLFDFNS